MRAARLSLLAVLTALLLPTAAFADLGDVDATWGASATDDDPAGLVFPVPGESGWDIKDVETAGGATYVLAQGENDGAVAELWKLTASGALDGTFGNGGRVDLLRDDELTDAGFGARRYFFAGVAVAADGSIYAGGTRVPQNSVPESGDGRFFAVKLTTSGARDVNFKDTGASASDGMSVVFGDEVGYVARDIEAYPPGGVVIAGKVNYSTTGGSDIGMGAIVLDGQGQRVTGIGPDVGSRPGLLYADVPGTIEDIEMDGNAFVGAGYSEQTGQTGAAIVRWDEDGADDQSFDQDGLLVQSNGVGAGFTALALQGGVITAAGVLPAADPDAPYQWVVHRYNGAGQPDTDFGAGGRRELEPRDRDGFSAITLEDLAITAPDGSLQLIGSAKAGVGGSTAYWAALGGNGAIDPRVGGGGRYLRNIGISDFDAVGGADLDSSGRLVVAGTTSGPYVAEGASVERPTVFRLSNTRTAPDNTTPPTLDGGGTAKFGDTLNVTDGDWRAYGAISFEYAWERCDAAHGSGEWATTTGCTAIGDTAKSRVLTESDVDKWVRAKVTAFYSGPGEDPNVDRTWVTTAEKISAGPIRSDGRPTLSPDRSVAVGEAIQVIDENFSGGPVTEYEYLWHRCPTANPPHFPDGPDPCPAIVLPGTQTAATDESYTPTAEDAGSHIRVYIQAKGGPSAASAFSYSETRQVLGGGGAGTVPQRASDPVIAPAGAVTEGDTLRQTAAAQFSGTPAPSVRLQWQRCGGTAATPAGCSAIGGATGEAYATTSADANRVVRLRAIAENAAGSAVADSSARDVREKPAEQQAPRPVEPKPVSTRHSTAMPAVVGMTFDEAREKIEKAGIFADVVYDVQARKKPLVLKGRKLDPGQVHSQSTKAGTQVSSAIDAKHKVKLVVEGGKPGFQGCVAKTFTRELKGIDLDATHELLKEKGCANRVNWDFKVAGSADEPEVRSASKDGRELQVVVTVPKDQAEYDLFPFHGQGAYLSDPTPSFGIDDLALTAGDQNVFGVRVFDRYIGDEKVRNGARRVIGAKVYVDGDAVGTEDQERTTREDTGSMAIFGNFRPSRAGTVRYLVQAQDGRGNKIFGFGQFPVKKRSGKFQTISGEMWNASPAGISLASRAKNQARAASLEQMWRWTQDLFRGGPLNALAAAGKSATEGLISLAKKGAGPVIFAASGVANALTRPISLTSAQVVAAGGANVVAAGGANVVAAGGLNLIGAAAGNVVAPGGANVVAAGGLNLIGKEKFVSGTGSLRTVIDAKLLSDNGLGLISDNGLGLVSDNGLGLHTMSKVIAPSDGATVVAAGGLNLIGPAAGN